MSDKYQTDDSGSYSVGCSATDVSCSEMSERDHAVVENKSFRVELDNVLQRLKQSPRKSRNRSLCITHLEDSIMRLGMDMKELDTPNPYPNSYNPENTVVDPTADGLKL